MQTINVKADESRAFSVISVLCIILTIALRDHT